MFTACPYCEGWLTVPEYETARCKHCGANLGAYRARLLMKVIFAATGCLGVASAVYEPLHGTASVSSVAALVLLALLSGAFFFLVMAADRAEARRAKARCRFYMAKATLPGMTDPNAPLSVRLEDTQTLSRHAQEGFGEGSAEAGACLAMLGKLHSETGNPEEAIPCLEKALQIHRDRRALGSLPPGEAGLLNNLAYAYRRTGRVEDAETCYSQARDIDAGYFGPDHEETLTDITNLAILRLERNDASRDDRGRARKDLEFVREVHRYRLPPSHPFIAEDHLHLSSVLRDDGDWGGAERETRRALEILEQFHPDRKVLIANTRCNVAVLLREQGRNPEAVRLLESARAVHEEELGPDHPDLALDLGALAIGYTALGDSQKALRLLEDAARIDDRYLGKVFVVGSERQRLEALRPYQSSLGLCLSLVAGHLPTSAPAVRFAFELVLRRKALAAEALAAQRDAVLGGRHPHLKPTLDELRGLRWRIARESLAGQSAELKALDDQRERLERELARQVPEIKLERELRAADRGAVARGLPEGAALVEFIRFDVFAFQAVPARGEPRYRPAHYLAFVLAAREPDGVRLIDLGEAEPIDRLIAEFRSGITSDAADPAAREDAGGRLRAAVFDRLAPALGKRRRLVLAPEGDLTRLPFEVLPAAGGHLLMETYQISYVGCGRDVLRFGTESTGQGAEPLVVADPDFDLGRPTDCQPQAARSGEPVGRRSHDLDRSMYHFAPLPGTREEGERVAALLRVQPWLGAAALEGRLKQECRSPRILHLATHGFFLQDQPRDPNRGGRELSGSAGPGSAAGLLPGALPENPLLRSGLALAGAQTSLDGGQPPPEAEDGLLTAEDVSGLDLLGTDLVVLSACETGLGEVHTGEGVFGLQRAFVLAGARTLVMSLWNVPDDATQVLMVNFYERLLRGESRAAALRAAQDDLRRQYPDPFYWGAFVCLGDPGPLRQPTA
jgi:CHAT domain-containing protein/tetratricopeptide (TPR) repeat protein